MNQLTSPPVRPVSFVTGAAQGIGRATVLEFARRGYDVALLDCQQMEVAGDLPRCIRLLAHAWLHPQQSPVHPYLREAAGLRPDRAQP